MPDPRASTTEPWYREQHGRRTCRTVECVHTALFERARAAPERTLLVDAEAYVSQRELVERIERRAHALLARAGAADRTVAVRLAPGIESVVSYFACLTAGLRYLPVATTGTGTAELVERLAPSLVLTHASLAGELPIETLVVEAEATGGASRNALPPADPHRIAHVLPTSGTTGDPKAVLTDHVGSMLSHAWRARLLADEPSRDVVGCNVFGIWDVVPALLDGVPLVMLGDAELRDPQALAGRLVRYGITRLMLTPTLLDACLADTDGREALARLRSIVLCGEPVTASLMARAGDALPGVRLVNLYSLAECHDVAAGDLEPGAPITSGHVAEFAEVHITAPEDRTRLLRVGEPGRVLVGGAGLAAGYLDPARTAERFFEARFGAQPGRVYDTGDLGLMHADGRLEIRGRVDSELKVRGAWADPARLEAVLQHHAAVARAAVVAAPGPRGHARLVAFVVAREPAARELEHRLYGFVRERVDAALVPARIRIVDALPVTASGKIDARRLQALETHAADAAASAPSASRPSAPLETAVIEALHRVLGRDDVGREATLESLGVDSLATIELAAELERCTGRRVRVAELEPGRSAAAIAARLGEREARVERRRPALPEPLRPLGRTARRARPRPIGHVLVTGATGMLGRALVGKLLARRGYRVTALVRAANAAAARARLEAALAGHNGDVDGLEVVAGDLGAPRLGLTDTTAAALAAELDAVVHAGADVDMFADDAALEPVNVGGTRAVLELAAAAGARCVHVSSSAALPLGAPEIWDETSYGRTHAESIAARLARSDGYSRTKLAAETLVWDALTQGLDVTAVRIPHLVGPDAGSRLAETLDIFALARVVPEGPWRWQLARVDTVAARIEALLARDLETPLVHVTTRPIEAHEVARLLRRHDAGLRIVSLPATVTALARAGPQTAAGRRLLKSADRLVGEYGPRSALSLADAELAAREPLADDAGALLESIIESSRERIAR